MRRLFLSSLLSFFMIVSYSQQTVADSMLHLLKAHPAKDSTRLNILLGLSEAYSEFDPVVGIERANEAIELGRLLKNDQKTGGAYRIRALNYYYQFEYDKAEKDLYSALSFYVKTDLNGQIASCHYMLGHVFYAVGRYQYAIAQYDSAILYHTRNGSLSKIPGILNSIGANYYALGDFSRAVDFYYQALKASEKQKDFDRAALCRTNIGMIYKEMGRYEKAREYYRRSLTHYQTTKNHQNEADIIMKIGITYDAEENSAKAIELYQQSYQLSTKIDYERGERENASNIGIAYLNLLKYDSTIVYLQRSLTLLRNSSDKRNITVVLNFLGRAYVEAPSPVMASLKISEKNRFATAESLLNEALTIAIEINALERQLSVRKALAAFYERKKDYRKAYENSLLASALSDSIFNDTQKESITREQIKYEYEKEQAILDERHAAELKRQTLIRNMVIAGAVVLIVLGILIFSLYKYRRDAELKAQVADIELKVMRLQMNPHFIFNSLNSISQYILNNQVDAADAYLSKFAKVMRLTLEHSEKKLIPLADELKALELYIQLEQKRVQPTFRYSIQIDPSVDPAMLLVPPLILQPFVENSIWHGLSKKQTDDGLITIRIAQSDDMLFCTIEDNGVGLQHKAAVAPGVPTKQSLGTKITRARIELLNRISGSNASVQLFDKPDGNGTSAQLHLPLEKAF